jgi:hypothetical protein
VDPSTGITLHHDTTRKTGDSRLSVQENFIQLIRPRLSGVLKPPGSRWRKGPKISLSSIFVRRPREYAKNGDGRRMVLYLENSGE